MYRAQRAVQGHEAQLLHHLGWQRFGNHGEFIEHVAHQGGEGLGSEATLAKQVRERVYPPQSLGRTCRVVPLYLGMHHGDGVLELGWLSEQHVVHTGVYGLLYVTQALEPCHLHERVPVMKHADKSALRAFAFLGEPDEASEHLHGGHLGVQLGNLVHAGTVYIPVWRCVQQVAYRAQSQLCGKQLGLDLAYAFDEFKVCVSRVPCHALSNSSEAISRS